MWAARIFEPRGFVDERLYNGGLIKIHTRPYRPNRFLYVFFYMVSLFLLLGCNLSYIVDLFAALHELASASARTLQELASSVRAVLKPYGDTLRWLPIVFRPCASWFRKSCDDVRFQTLSKSHTRDHALRCRQTWRPNFQNLFLVRVAWIGSGFKAFIE